MRSGLLALPDTNFGFSITDYSTGRRLGIEDELLVLVPKRDVSMGAPPASSAARGSFDDRRRFFRTASNGSGYIVAFHVPFGTYDLRVFARGYIPSRRSITAPSPSPIAIKMHRDVTYPFGAEDTLIFGRVETSSGKLHTGFDVELIDPAEDDVPHHVVPLNARGEFVMFIPEKKDGTKPVKLAVTYAGGKVPMVIPNFLLHRTNFAPLARVP